MFVEELDDRRLPRPVARGRDREVPGRAGVTHLDHEAVRTAQKAAEAAPEAGQGGAHFDASSGPPKRRVDTT